MSENGQPSPSRATPDIQDLLRKLVREAKLGDALLDICCKIALNSLLRSPLPSIPKDLTVQARELALDFILYLQVNDSDAITTQSGLRRQFRRFCARKSAPANHELWEILSSAVGDLVETGKLRRLDADPGAANCNDAVYSVFGSERDAQTLDEQLFQAASERKCPFFYPKKGRSVGSIKLPKILSPKDATKLLLCLLDAAGGPVSFRSLFEAAKNHHVFIPREGEYRPPPEETEDEPTESRDETIDPETFTPTDGKEPAPDMNVWLPEEAEMRANRIWDQVALSGLRDVLCRYYLPKHAGGQKCALKDLGQPQRVNEQVAELQAILACELRVEKVRQESGENMTEAVRILAELVLEKLLKQCSENA
ncbi:MAG: hypothetical protein HY360_25865 [Verrucomicrobia bacterium]|nr:hypothetical protein [Verrucomicrobiota bacterium]